MHIGSQRISLSGLSGFIQVFQNQEGNDLWGQGIRPLRRPHQPGEHPFGQEQYESDLHEVSRELGVLTRQWHGRRLERA